ncbi:Transcription factor like [Actinidia chinensis var. chinensis]|uniref:Transcription factor like n=1 Tax=Actinidia chinensis var. chinensis TaxID=1590841 RepID=A0A2R6PPS2_ACTCC|nr:Transcription factor like [Actinidia chinensis var. chinensis]
MTPHLSSTNPNSIKTRFAYKFLRALKRLNKRRPTSPPHPNEIFRWFRMIKTASYSSMASAVGSRKGWSQAMLRKIWCRALETRRRRRRRRRCGGMIRRSSGERNKADELRSLLPGGEAMDFCSLLGETAHYIRCLTTQVQVMRNIVDLCST